MYTRESNYICGYINSYRNSSFISLLLAETSRIWLDDVFCTGSESEVLDCSHDGIGIHDCDHFEDASVRCDEDSCK